MSLDIDRSKADKSLKTIEGVFITFSDISKKYSSSDKEKHNKADEICIKLLKIEEEISELISLFNNDKKNK